LSALERNGLEECFLILDEIAFRREPKAEFEPQKLVCAVTGAEYEIVVGKIAVGTLRGRPSTLMEGVQNLAAAKYLKARGLTDNMITRAFQALGQRPAAAPAPPPVTPPGTATGAGIGAASGNTARLAVLGRP
jgi:hypothetical protein